MSNTGDAGRLPKVSDSELNGALEAAGFSPYQADVYVALLELGTATVPEIASSSGVPDARVYDVLRTLESDGYLETFEQDSLRARVHDYESLKDDLIDKAARFSNASKEIERRWEKPSLEETSVNFVTRFETALESAAEAIENATTQVQVVVTPEQFKRLRPALKTAYENGIGVYLSLSIDKSEDLPDSDAVGDACTEARHRRLPSPFLTIVDRSKVHFAPHAASTNEYGLIVDDRTHAYVFHWFFVTTQWDVWDPIKIQSDNEAEYLDVRYLVEDIQNSIQAGKSVRVYVEGADTETGDRRTVDGTVQEIIVDHEPEVASLVKYGGQVTILIETDTGIVEVGGWGALVEDVEAHRIRIVSIE